jgi:hypothetical protein
MRGGIAKYPGKITTAFVYKLGKMNEEERGKTVFDLNKEFNAIHHQLGELSLRRGEIACLIAESKAYQVLGYESLLAWMAEPEKKLRQRQVFRVMKAWHKWTNELGFPVEEYHEVPLKILETVAGIVTKETAKEWMSKMKSLSTEDILKEINEDKGIIEEDCEHEFVEKCKKCRRVKMAGE